MISALAREGGASPPRIVFLDRDGVINEFPGKGLYVTRREDLRVLPRAARGIALLKAMGYEIFVITNQGCISRRYLTVGELEAMHVHLMRELEAEGAKIDGIFYCPHQTSDACDCKKPKTALFKKAVAGRSVDFARAFFVGDSEEDIAAGRALGCRTVLVLSGRTRGEDIAALAIRPDVVKKDLWEAAEWIAAKS